jgi:site-specific DNA-methyltransferase (adenine-specific)
MGNALYDGDNLSVLRESVAGDSVDLIYLNPPFNSQATYNVLFKGPSGEGSEAQIEAFEDTWHWGEEAERAFSEVLASPSTHAAELLRAMRSFLGENDMMAYLVMMAVRLIELHRVLKPTGSLYLHCDPTASHYLKVLLDGVFGAENFRSEIICKRSTSHGNTLRAFGNLTDTILYYSKHSRQYVWNQQYIQFTSEYIEKYFLYSDPDRRRWQSAAPAIEQAVKTFG